MNDELYPEGLIRHMTLDGLARLIIAHEDVRAIRAAHVERKADLEREYPTIAAVAA